MPLPYANTLTSIVAVLLVLRELVGSNPTARFVSVFTYGNCYLQVTSIIGSNYSDELVVF